MGVDTLVRDEIEAKTIAVTEAEVNDFINQNRARIRQARRAPSCAAGGRLPPSAALNQRRDAYVASLRAQTPVQVYLKEPEPIRVKVDPNVGFARGLREAPVTIVEFSDFQCPYCRSVVATLKTWLPAIRTVCRWCFGTSRSRTYTRRHRSPTRPRAALATRGNSGRTTICSSRETNLTPDALKRYAAQVGLEASAFAQCLDSRRHRAAVAADVAAGAQLGVTGTPTFFINGRPLVGNVPLAEFQRVIERELAKTAATK